MENIDDGRRFFDTAKRVGKRKPIVLLKGGQTMEGNRAASSHTGAMAANADVFNGMCRQAGIIKVDLPMELLDLSAAFSALPLPRGRRIGIMTLGGGWGVVTADLCARYGLSVPELSEPIIRRLDEQLPPYWSRSNPVDLVGERDLGLPLSALECLLAWEGCDAVIHLGILGRRHFVTRLADTAETADPGGSCESCALARQALADFEAHYIKEIARLMAHYQKPVVGVRLLTASSDRTVYPLDDGPYAAVFYETPERAVRAIAGMADYHRFLRLPEK
jgi:acyl-CoA synthetase (NDP forming)